MDLFLVVQLGFSGVCRFTSYQAKLAVEYASERGTVMAWNNTDLYIGITLGSMLGRFVITEWGYLYLPYVCSIAAGISFILSIQKGKESKESRVVSEKGLP